jgi:hypothetical protein
VPNDHVSPGAPSAWVEPDYTTIADEATLAGGSPYRDWPGPPLIMPGELLPDGKPMGSNEMENARRITGVKPRTEQEADACVVAYWNQQNLLREELGLPRAKRLPPTYDLQDTPETLAKIVEIHRRERVRRLRDGQAGGAANV